MSDGRVDLAMSPAKSGTGRVRLPEGELDGAQVVKFEVPQFSIENLRYAINGGRQTTPGWYTKLVVDGQLWMSDTDAEWWDHYPAVRRIRSQRTKRVLINGLGLGMVVQAALDQPHVEHIDIVELDRRVIDLVGPTYERDPRVRIIEGDAYTVKWDPGTRWDVAWHDIWPDLTTDNLPEMAKLHRRYGGRVGWQGSWGKELLLNKRRQDQRRENW